MLPRLGSYAWSLAHFYGRVLARAWPVWLFLFLDAVDLADLFLRATEHGKFGLAPTQRAIAAVAALAWAAGDIYHQLWNTVEDDRAAIRRRRRAQDVARQLGEYVAQIRDLGPFWGSINSKDSSLYDEIEAYISTALGPSAVAMFIRNTMAPPPPTDTFRNNSHFAFHTACDRQAGLERIIQAILVGELEPFPVDTMD